MIAFVGSEASGKSTSTNEIYTWLEKRFDVSLIHLGKPKSSWRTKPFWVLIFLYIRLSRLKNVMNSRRTNTKKQILGQAENRPHPFISLLDSFDRRYWVQRHLLNNSVVLLLQTDILVLMKTLLIVLASK